MQNSRWATAGRLLISELMNEAMNLVTAITNIRDTGMPQIIPTDWTKVMYFNPGEFACRCCGISAMDFNFIQMLDKIRHEYGKPMRISSGYRCPAHNASVSSTGTSGPHTTGLASDVAIAGHDAYAILNLAVMMGATGIGVAQKGNWNSRFIHIDVLPIGDKRPWIWSY